jgi:regulator of ribonuclease activity A
MDFYTAKICDMCDDGIQILAPNFKNFGKKQKMHGKIVTVKINQSSKELSELLQEEGKGQVVVVDAQAEHVAIIDEGLAKLALKNGWAGFIVNGHIRYAQKIADIDVGVWALGTSPKKIHDPLPGFLNHSLEFGGVKFEPGMYLYADHDGVVINKEALA